jgi:exodeoxyribonuclease-3
LYVQPQRYPVCCQERLFTWLEKQQADVVCVQELKAQEKDVVPTYQEEGGLCGFFHYAEKPGYSGVGLYARKQPDRVRLA